MTSTISIISQCCRATTSRSFPSSTACSRSLSTSRIAATTQRRRLQLSQQRRNESTASVASPSNSKIASIVDQISRLTLLETADLVSSLKSRLNIPDMAFAAPSAGGSAGPAAAAAVPAEEEAAPAVQEKTMFTLKLEKFDAAAKPKVIKEIKSMLGLSLVDSKKFVESAPKVMKEGVAKEEAEKIVAAMKALGAEVKME